MIYISFYPRIGIFSICRGQALAVAPEGRRKAGPLPRFIEKILELCRGSDTPQFTLRFGCSS